MNMFGRGVVILGVLVGAHAQADTYAVDVRWGGAHAPWHDGGTWTLGARDDQPVVAARASSSDGGATLTGNMTYAGEGPIDLRATHEGANHYSVENRWGGAAAPWHDGGAWVIGARDDQRVVAFDLSSTDGGATLTGSATYAGEGPIDLRAQRIEPATGTRYAVRNQWGGDHAPWHDGGSWALGCRPEQPILELHLASEDGGASLFGTMTYAGEGPIDVQAEHLGGNQYSVENGWAGTWHDGGMWVIGGRDGQAVVSLDASSPDDGRTLVGTMTYAGEGPIAFRGETAQAPSREGYRIQNRWGGLHGEWHDGGVWVVGGRAEQAVVSVEVVSDDDGATLTGSMTYAGEGPIDLRATHLGDNRYLAEVRWGGVGAPWREDGEWVLGARDDQRVVKLELSSEDGGASLVGTVTYAGEGPIDLRGTRHP